MNQKRNYCLIILILFLIVNFKSTALASCTGPVVRVACPGNLWKLNMLLGKKQYLEKGLMESSLSKYIMASETQGGECQCEPLLPIANALLKEGADPNHKTEIPSYKGEKPLILVFRNEEIPNNEKLDWTKLLHSYGADLNATTSERNKRIPLLHLNVRAGRIKVVEYLLKNGANPDLTDDYGRTALFLASKYNNTGMIKLLLDREVNKEILTKDISLEGKTIHGKTALMEAIDMGNYEAVQMLLAYGASVDTRSSDGRDALMRVMDNIRYLNNSYSMRVPKSEEKLEKLVRIGISLMIYSSSGGKISDDDLKMISNINAGNHGTYEIVKRDERFGFRNKKGEIVIPCTFDAALPFSHGLFPVKKEGKWAYLNEKGDTIIGLEKDVKAMPFYGDTAVVIKGRKFGAVNKEGDYIIAFDADLIHGFEAGVAVFRKKDKVGYLGNNGRLIAKAVYDFAPLRISEGLISVRRDMRSGFINKKGEVVIPLKYETLMPFKEGLARFRVNKKWGYVNLKAEETVTARFKDAMDFSEGLAPVKLNKEWGFIDKNGKTVIKFRFKGIYNGFKNGFAKMNLCDEDDCWAVINKEGKITEKASVDTE